MRPDPTCAGALGIQRGRATTANHANILLQRLSGEAPQRSSGGGERRRPNFGARSAPGAVRGADARVRTPAGLVPTQAPEDRCNGRPGTSAGESGPLIQL